MSAFAPISAVMRDSFTAVVAAAKPQNFMVGKLPPLSDLLARPDAGAIVVIAAGKAAGGMATAAEQYYPPDIPMRGCVILPHGQIPPPLSRLAVMHAAHPLPDENSVQAAQTALQCAQTASANDAVLVLLSGGASSLLGAPLGELTLSQLRDICRQLLNAAADVREINIVRRQLCAAAGGRLAAGCKAPVHALICSDVTNGAAADIASGPCAPSPTAAEDALAVLRQYGVADNFPTVCAQLQQGAFATPPPAALAHALNAVIFESHTALCAAEKILAPRGLHIMNEGEQSAPVKTLAEYHLRRLAECVQQRGLGVAMMSGGEGLAAVSGNTAGRGGRNTAFALHAWQNTPLILHDNLHGLSCDTDGIDGAQTAAGALWTPQHRRRAAALNLSPQQFLEHNDSGGFFAQIDGLVQTGPTGANVSDYRVLICADASI